MADFPIKHTGFSTVHIGGLTKEPTKFGPNYTVVSGPKNVIFTLEAFIWSKYFWNFITAIFLWFFVLAYTVTIAIALDLVKVPNCSVFCEDP